MSSKDDSPILVNGQSAAERMAERVDTKRAIETAQLESAQGIAARLNAQASLWRAFSTLVWLLLVLFAIPALFFAIRLAQVAQTWTP